MNSPGNKILNTLMVVFSAIGILLLVAKGNIFLQWIGGSVAIVAALGCWWLKKLWRNIATGIEGVVDASFKLPIEKAEQDVLIGAFMTQEVVDQRLEVLSEAAISAFEQRKQNLMGAIIAADRVLAAIRAAQSAGFVVDENVQNSTEAIIREIQLAAAKKGALPSGGR